MSTARRLALLAALAATNAGCGTAPAPAPWTELFDGRSLGEFAVTDFGGQGPVTVERGRLRLGMGSPLTGVTWTGALPGREYELEVTAARHLGVDFFCGLTFPVGEAHLTLVLGGWGGSVCGLSNLDGEDAAHNHTRVVHRFETDRDYVIRVAVTNDRVDVTLDGEPLLGTDLAARTCGLRPEVLLSRPLGFACFLTEASLRSLRWRPVRGPAART